MNSPNPKPNGRRRWAIAEGYIPPTSSDPNDPRFVSHETACMLNCNDVDAHVTLHIYFKDRDPAGPYVVTVPARRTLHLRFNDLAEPEPVLRDTPYALRQHHRSGCADSRAAHPTRFAPSGAGIDIDGRLRRCH